MFKEEDTLKFRKLFGIDPRELNGRIIISPFFKADFFKPYLKNRVSFKGLLYHGIKGVYQQKTVIYINAGIGHILVRDCILAQNSEQVQKIIFLGTAGAVSNFKIGDCVLVKKAFFDFPGLIPYFKNKSEDNYCCANTSLLKDCDNFLRRKNVVLDKIDLISLNSLWQQTPAMALNFKQRNIAAVDLECAVFYGAAKQKNIKALAFCYISDLFLTKPYWTCFSKQEKTQMKKSREFLIAIALGLSVS
ncbi:MAG: hypothetical protein DRP78_04480 [Candidatus Omnitrophota bacterium]|nr:MAG: hypothetical protein DRP78_04480 [Candidatus Omnitrophota bacterium]